MIDNLNDFNMAASSVPALASQQNVDTPRPSSVATDGYHDAKNKIKEGYGLAQPIELLIINVVALTVEPPLGYQKPKRRKKDRDPLIDSRKVGSPNGWMYEQRERTNVKYVGKVDQVQFYYEPGTNKQFRSIKEIDKQLKLKGKKIQSIAPQALQENDRQKLAHDSRSNIPKKNSIATNRRRGEITGNDHQKIESPPVIDLSNVVMQDFGSNQPKKRRKNKQKLETSPVLDPINYMREPAKSLDTEAGSFNPDSSNKSRKEKWKRKKAAAKQINFDFKSSPTEIKWSLADVKSDQWTSYMGHVKVLDELDHYWANASKEISSPKNQDYNKRIEFIVLILSLEGLKSMEYSKAKRVLGLNFGEETLRKNFIYLQVLSIAERSNNPLVCLINASVPQLKVGGNSKLEDSSLCSSFEIILLYWAFVGSG